MSAFVPQRQSDPPPAQQHPSPKIYALEAKGLLVIAILVVIVVVIRYWHNIAWSAR